MSQGPPGRSPREEPSVTPSEGWHCSHLYYRFDRPALAAMEATDIQSGRRQVTEALDSEGPDAPARLQTSIVSGHKADFALLLMDADPLRIDAVHQRLAASALGPALAPTYSFVSRTEVSEYLASVEEYAARLAEAGEEAGSDDYEKKVKAYADRLPIMRRQRLTPDLPNWPATCFYPMNRKREQDNNWFLLPFDERNRLMAEHGRSGMAFGGKVTQLVTVGIGLDDWEWGVTLWARNPQYLTEIVYQMRYDEASARYAEFGPFYTGYVATPDAMLNHCRIGA